MLVFIRNRGFVYLAVILVAFGLESAAASSTEPHTGVVAAADGVPLHYSMYGAGSPALILVHGFSCDQNYWNEQVAPFSRDFRVVTMDLAGHGESGLGRKEWTMEAYGSDVAAVVEALDLKSVILIGHSMGGAVILKAATYEDFATWWTTEEMEEFLAPFRENFVEAADPWIRSMFLENSDPAFIEQIVTDMSSAPPEVALASLESAITVMVGRERTTALRGLDAPVFVINADYGPTDVESMERDGVEVHIIPGTGHFFMMEDSARFNSVLTDVVESIVD
jgi:pimeloyl-ACP methyl ester carboxylesterase